ncbi:ubiquitin-conjugating enzyme domain containing protein [Plasmodium cynomolgi strain B]|uniref:Ubiquitin-conjugating enzyme domain containing protein n=1 Tax=Plasmodium cynomolgi (strain B) TaxID=1120755 RepID=K6V214_PLACD|nr:ubiquitin-conjugating enzyme domain containing protein [Plasmodium cynomolgi strain B]GAB69255.1 ubiquitin-conjugating enzyme domain containing protein [Plasmodium cynomolgi strain B]
MSLIFLYMRNIFYLQDEYSKENIENEEAYFLLNNDRESFLRKVNECVHTSNEKLHHQVDNYMFNFDAEVASREISDMMEQVKDDPLCSRKAEAFIHWLINDYAGGPSGEKPSGEKPSEEKPSEEIPSEDPASDEILSEDPPSEEILSEDPASDEIPSEDPPSDEIPSEDSPRDGAAEEGAPPNEVTPTNEVAPPNEVTPPNEVSPHHDNDKRENEHDDTTSVDATAV